MIGNLRSNPLCCGGSRQTARGKSFDMIVGTKRLTGETSKRKRRGGIAVLCVGEGKKDPAWDVGSFRSPLSPEALGRLGAEPAVRRGRRRNCAGSRETAMEPGQPLRSRKKNRSSRFSVFGVCKFPRRSPQSPMPAFGRASAARGARSRRRLVPAVRCGFAGPIEAKPVGFE